MALAPVILRPPQVQDLAPTTSRVYPGADNKLVYVPDEQGNAIIDSSHAGYGGGGVAIPTVPVRETIWPVAGDNTENIQAAINKVAARSLDAGGLRGAVLLKAGYYRMATPVRIEVSGVVLRGEGMGDTGTILIGTGTGRTANAAGPGGGGGNQGTLVMVGGASGVTLKEETKQIVTDDYVPVGARKFKLAAARNFRTGDAVIVRRIGNQAWIDAVGMSGPDNASRWRPFNVEWDRVVVEVEGDSITIDAPITCAIEKRWGGGEVLKYEEGGRIEKVGVENMRAMSEFDPTKRTREYGNMDRPNYVAEEYYNDENHYRNFVIFDNMKNGWVRNTTALHFVYSMVGTSRGAKWVTAGLCVTRAGLAESGRIAGSHVRAAGDNSHLCSGVFDEGRHFMSGQPTSSANVFSIGKATTFSPRAARAMGHRQSLRQCSGPAYCAFLEEHQHRWGSEYGVLNCEGSFLVQKPPTAQNFSFASRRECRRVQYPAPGSHERKRTHRITDKHVMPRSLYLTQLRERVWRAAFVRLPPRANQSEGSLTRRWRRRPNLVAHPPGAAGIARPPAAEPAAGTSRYCRPSISYMTGELTKLPPNLEDQSCSCRCPTLESGCRVPHRIRCLLPTMMPLRVAATPVPVMPRATSAGSSPNPMLHLMDG
jgi:hypothetical protein